MTDAASRSATYPRAAFEATRGNVDALVGELAAFEYLRNWHNDEHDGVVESCMTAPCFGLVEVLRPARHHSQRLED